MKDFYRSDRVAGQLRRELASLLQQEVKDPLAQAATVSDVEVSRDISYANVFVIVSSGTDPKACLKALQRASGFIRTRLGKLLRMRHIPELRFKVDDSIDRGEQIDALLRKLNQKDSY